MCCACATPANPTTASALRAKAEISDLNIDVSPLSLVTLIGVGELRSGWHEWASCDHRTGREAVSGLVVRLRYAGKSDGQQYAQHD